MFDCFRSWYVAANSRNSSAYVIVLWIFSSCLLLMSWITWIISIIYWSTNFLSYLLFTLNTDSRSGRMCCTHKLYILALSSTYDILFALNSLYFTIYFSDFIPYYLSSRTGTSFLISGLELSSLYSQMGSTGSTLLGCAISSIALEPISPLSLLPMGLENLLLVIPNSAAALLFPWVNFTS